MNKKGFLLIHVLLGLFLFGLVAITCLPILNLAINNLTKIRTKMEMTFTAESIIEQIKSFDYNNTSKTELIFDIQLIELMEILDEEEETIISLPLDQNNQEYKYICNIYKKQSSNIWEIKVNIKPVNEVENITYVEIMAFLPIPEKDSTY